MIEPEQTKQPTRREQEPSQSETAAMIADTLGETEAPVRHKIETIVRVLGRTQSHQLLNFALQAEEHGGMMLPDGSRRRTTGGIFFHYAHTLGVPKPGKSLSKQQNPAQKSKNPDIQPVTPKPPKAPEKLIITFSWDDRIATIQEADTEKGTATTVKITVVGRPGKILDKSSCIVTVMEESKTPSLPKGLPTPTSTPVKYTIYIASKQWTKVKEAIQDSEDVLIVEGFPKTDPEVSAIAIFATSVTTKKLQMAKKQPQVTQ